MTAIEWLHVEFQKRFPKETTEMYNNNQFEYEDMIIKAKKMEKKQIMEAWLTTKTITFNCWKKEFEEYYNEK